MINLEFSTLGGKRKRPKKNLSSSVKRSWDCSRLRILQKNQESIKMQVYPYLKIKLVYFLGLPDPIIFLICHFSVHFTEVRFDSFLSGGFIIAIVVNSPEKKLAKCISVQWRQLAHQSRRTCSYARLFERKTHVPVIQPLSTVRNKCCLIKVR